MKLIVYKGFGKEFLEKLNDIPLVNNEIDIKLNVLKFNKKTKRELGMSLLSLEYNDVVWVTYEEYTLVKKYIDDAIKEDGLEVMIFTNNIYPDYYPIPFEVSNELLIEIEKNLNTSINNEVSLECRNYLNIYNGIAVIDDVYYGSFYNFEYNNEEKIIVQAYFPDLMEIEESQVESDLNIFINEDIETYLRDLSRIKKIKPNLLGVKKSDGLVSQRIFKSLSAYCIENHIKL